MLAGFNGRMSWYTVSLSMVSSSHSLSGIAPLGGLTFWSDKKLYNCTGNKDRISGKDPVLAGGSSSPPKCLVSLPSSPLSFPLASYSTSISSTTQTRSES